MISVLKIMGKCWCLGLLGMVSAVPGQASENEAKQGVADVVPFRADSSYVSRHDIVYQSPMKVPVEGVPLGNGKMGGLVWTQDRGIEFQIHKDDIWSNSEAGHSGRVPRHAARVRLDFGVPVFSWIHALNNFQGRLSLERGEASFASQSNFGDVQVRTWLAQDRNVWVIECEGSEDAAPVTAHLERIGSRAFAFWYSGGFDRQPGTALGGSNPQVASDGRTVLLTEKGSGMDFVVGMRVAGNGKARAERLNRFSGEVSAPSAKCRILVAVATAEDSPNPAQAVQALLDGAEKAGVEQMRKTKDEWFKRFWNKSFVHLGDDYLENLWYLRRYLMGCGSRGKYPVIFNGGLWRWNRDVTNWVSPHHWNMQQQYWGLCAQNDVDLMRPYWETYNRMAEKPGMKNLAAARGAKNDAILLAEMHDFDGTMVDQNRGDMVHAFTQAAQVASRFWEVYEFTKDKEFLRKTAYPFMQRAANFYLQKLVWDEGRKVFTMNGSVYEDGNGFGPAKEPESDREYIEDLFLSCIAASKELGIQGEHVAKMQHVLDHLWPRLYMNSPKYPAGEVIAPTNGGRYEPHGWAIGGLAAFPSGNIGIDQRETKEGRAVANFVKGTESMYSHHPTPVIAARMGMGDDALRLLKTGVQTMQYFPSGLMFNCTGYPDKIYQLDHKTNMVGRINLLWKDFYQCGMETTSLVSLALTEMLLQSNEGKIRVFPAVPAEWKDREMAFKLLARGGFLVAADWKKGSVGSIGIASRLGGECVLQNPWPGKAVEVRQGANGAAVAVREKGADVIAFDTVANGQYRITPAGVPANAEPVLYRSTPNKAPKKAEWGPRTIGTGQNM
ncbi:glycosyl hydrolase family 95 catalytic domain-containing protein [Akkermansia glycaniphila]|nr:DUF5703 domain-containing protein [Akkermansia glycaniphila]